MRQVANFSKQQGIFSRVVVLTPNILKTRANCYKKHSM